MHLAYRNLYKRRFIDKTSVDNNPASVPVGSFPADDAFRFQVGEHPFNLPGAHTKVFGNLGGGYVPVGPKISKDAFLLVVEAFLIGNFGIGLFLLLLR